MANTGLPSCLTNRDPFLRNYALVRSGFRSREVVLRDPPEPTLKAEQCAIAGLAHMDVFGNQVPSLSRCVDQGIYKSKCFIRADLAPRTKVAKKRLDHVGLSHILELEPRACSELGIHLGVAQNDRLRFSQVDVCR